MFSLWRDGIDDGALLAPFHVTHVDAHADLGLGDSGYTYLLTELLHQPVDQRRYPKLDGSGLGDGNYLAFAVACRWISDLVYTYNEGGGSDLLAYLMDGFDPNADHIRMPVLTHQELKRVMGWQNPTVEHFEPCVPVRTVPWRNFTADAPFDAIFLARSPAFTPPESDTIFDAIRATFIDEA